MRYDTSSSPGRSRLSARRRRSTCLLIALAALAVGACAAIERQQTAGVIATLTEAGFTARPASDQTVVALGPLPAHTLVKRTDGGAIVYVFADPDGCHCVYQGNEAAYRRYLYLRENQWLSEAGTARGGRQAVREYDIMEAP